VRPTLREVIAELDSSPLLDAKATGSAIRAFATSIEDLMAHREEARRYEAMFAEVGVTKENLAWPLGGGYTLKDAVRYDAERGFSWIGTKDARFLLINYERYMTFVRLVIPTKEKLTGEVTKERREEWFFGDYGCWDEAIKFTRLPWKTEAMVPYLKNGVWYADLVDDLLRLKMTPDDARRIVNRARYEEKIGEVWWEDGDELTLLNLLWNGYLIDRRITRKLVLSVLETEPAPE